ncbi:MAG: hypothetical protein JWM10_5213 [Myxococcaceae bacterium]|nr:hypothetical protein [Myxococcaceae bacterium]
MYDPERVVLVRTHGIVLGVLLAAVGVYVFATRHSGSSGGMFSPWSDAALTQMALMLLGAVWLAYAFVTSVLALLICRTPRSILALHAVSLAASPALVYGLATLHG